MSLILIVSIVIRLVAMGLSIALLRHFRDWRVGFLTLMLGLMTLRQTLTLLAEKESWSISVTGHATELPGLAVSIMMFLAIFFLERVITQRKEAEEKLQKRIDENTKLAVIAEEQSKLEEWINTFDTFVGKFDPNGVMIFCNEGPIKAGGLTKDEVFGKYFPDTKWWSHSQIERTRIIECLERAKAGFSRRIETNFRGADGTPVPIIFNCQPMTDDDGKVKYITAEGKIIIEEVELRNALQEEKESLGKRVKDRTSELVAVTENLKEEITERARLEAETTEQWKVEKAISRILHEGLRSVDLTAAGQACLEVALEITSSAFGFVGELNDRGTFDTTFLADPGWEACRLPKDQAMVLISYMEVRGIWGEVIKHNKTLITNDPSSHPASVGTPEGHPPIRSFLGVPLSRGEKVFGAICVANKSGGYSEKDSEFLERLSVAFVMALDRSRAEEVISKHRRNLQRLSAQLIKAQEEERKRISQELHDEMGQALTGIRINVAAIEKELQSELTSKTKERLADIHLLTDQLLEQIRELSLELRPTMLDDLGLVPTIRWYLNRFSKRLNIEVDFKAIGLKERLTTEVETVLYRVMQESVTNIARHAQANNIRIHLERKNSTIVMSIEDDGTGFDLQKELDIEAGIYPTGLIGMEERIVNLGGSFRIHSHPGKGTRICVEIPWEEVS